MDFNFEFINGDVKECKKRVGRRAAKAIIYDENKHLLLIKSIKGDYKFVGGGVKAAETDEDGLKREIAEESGKVLTKVVRLAGSTLEKSIDRNESGTCFCMSSNYYICEIDGQKEIPLNLDDYENDLKFEAVFVSISDALVANFNVLLQGKENPWTRRETAVLLSLYNA